MKQINKSGFAAIVGRPNVGKSTLLNALVGQKIAIVSSKPQTTRNRIMGVMNEEDVQVVFVDTPGLHLPKTKLGDYMQKSASSAIYDVDVILMVVEPDKKLHPAEADLLEKLPSVGLPCILVINKTDIASPAAIAGTIELYRDAKFSAVVPLSAKTGDGVAILKEEILKHISEGVAFFPSDAITDQPERSMVAEIIREKALRMLDKEVPHGIAVYISSFKERADGVVEIMADIYCEKQSHKGIIIGKGGEMLKKIATQARKDIEELLDCKVFLQTYVKVKESWRDQNSMLKDFGYFEE